MPSWSIPSLWFTLGTTSDHLADQIAILVLDGFGDETGPNRLTIVVKLHLPIRRLEYERGECITEFLLAIAKVPIDLVERVKRSFRLVVIIDGAQGRAGEAIFQVAFSASW